VGDLVHVALDGVRITTPDIDAERAVVAIATTVENESRATRTVRVTTRILDADGAVAASGSAPVTLLPGASEVARMRLCVTSPGLWSADAPNLYTADTTVTDGYQVLDEERTTFGIRTLQLDAQRGLRINGQPVDLRDACIHHDNGLLGAAAITRADERRIELLTAAGFNAVRSAHNPLSKATLDACDRVGMLVMDETFDMWTEPKSPFDYALSFPEWWERDVEAMVAKGLQPPERDHVLDRQRDLRDRPPDRLHLGPQARRKGPLARRHPLRHQRHQPPGVRRPSAARGAGRRRQAGRRHQHLHRHDRRRHDAGQHERRAARTTRSRGRPRSPTPCSTSPASPTGTRVTRSIASDSPTASSSAPRPSPTTSRTSGGSSRTART
jgi:hypothetical protein